VVPLVVVHGVAEAGGVQVVGTVAETRQASLISFLINRWTDSKSSSVCMIQMALSVVRMY
jgi:hypothetical protein